MKYKTKLILFGIVSIVAASIILVEVDNYFNGQLIITSQQDLDTRHSILGFSISDKDGNSRQYTLDELDEIPCEDYLAVWQPEFNKLKEADLLNEKMSNCMQQTGGYTVESDKIKSSSVIFD